MEVVVEEWLTTGQAAKVSARDISTVRRWADTGIVHSRVSPGGRRQIALSSLLAAQPSPGRRDRHTASASPSDAIPAWAAASLEWYGWRPHRTMPPTALETLVVETRDIITTLRHVEESLITALRDRDHSDPSDSS